LTFDAQSLSRDFTSFADPATDLRVTSGTSGCRLEIVRHGVNHDYFMTYRDGSIVARHAKNRKVASVRSLLASPDFADIRGLAMTQVRMHRDFDVEGQIPPEGQLDDRPLALRTLQSVLNPRGTHATSEKVISVLLLDGPAGVGKTSLIQRFLVQRARAHQDASAAPPILHVTSRGRRLTALDDALAQSIQLLRADFTFDQVPTLIRQGLLQLAIDGFDELVDPQGYKDAWYALRDFFDSTEFGGPIILAGRDTFFDEQRFMSQMHGSKHAFQLNHVRLGPVSVSSAKKWLAKTGWHEKDLSSADTSLILRPGSYTLRPYFLYELSKARSWQAIESHDLTPRGYLVDQFIAREAKLIGEQLSVDADAIRARLHDVFEEIALEMADSETEVVDLSFLQMVTEVTFGDLLSSGDLAKLRHKAGSFALLESDARESFRRFPHTEISNHFLSFAVIRLVADGMPIRFLRRGIVASDLLSVFAEVFCAVDLRVAQKFVTALDKFLDEEASFDRLPENSAMLLLTSLCRDLGKGVRRYDNLQVSNVVLFGVVAPASLNNVKLQQFDAQEAEMSQVEFTSCEVVSLHADETTRFGEKRPLVHRIHLHQGNGAVTDIFDPTEIEAWLRSRSANSTVAQAINEEAARLLDRVCRIMMRQHMIKDHEDDNFGKVLRSRYWPQIEQILKAAGLVERVDGRAMSGTHAPFVRMRDPYMLLAQQSAPAIAKVWSKVSAIPK
jgi:hypothetical protein